MAPLSLSIDSAVYPFEGLLPDLESPPIAARRALDHAGFRLSVEGWRSLSTDERHKVTLAGLAERVDAERVALLLRRASPAAKPVAAVSDPDPTAPPEALAKALEPGRAIDPKRWARLRAVDRYALTHTYRRAVARSAFSILGEAFDAVLAANALTYEPGPAPRQDGGYPPRPAEAKAPPAWMAGTTPPAGRDYHPAGYYSSVMPPPGEADPGGPTTPRPPTSSPFERSAGTPTTRMRISSRPPISKQGQGNGPASTRDRISKHLNRAGEAHLCDVARKAKTERRAVARGSVWMQVETLSRFVGGDAAKDEVLAAARIAGIMAAKRTHEMIPLTHPVTITHLEIGFELDEPASSVHVIAVVDAYDRTGCEMEAMVAVSAACLTLYDMLNGIDRGMVIAEIKLMEKSGGRSGHYARAGQ